ncbi:FAD-dependent oxidoreductase [Nonomuraea turkmeniaca]|uniref:FAD-dependent oxidoreductase n=2 Tax=Nonomuraea turkmeniaca TaxID=103838 RepID=A0A5S4FU80_9ACTN|nr:FAD-dependent oxidoreductase [Nonomuraea turkmeniaca]
MSTGVVVVGGGPVGLMLAAELSLAGIRPVVLERLREPGDVPKANGLVGQIVQVLDYRGLLERFSAGAQFAGPAPYFQFGALPLDLRRLGTSPLHLLPIPQPRLERLLSERARELDVDLRPGHELTALRQDDDGVTADVRGPQGDYRLRTRYLVGCDGAHSLVRRLAGIGFPGTTGREVARFGDVTLPASVIVPGTGDLDLPWAGRVAPGFTRTETGVFAFSSFRPGVHRVAALEWGEPAADRGGPISLEELQAAVRRVLGADLPVERPHWLSRVRANSRQAERYRAGRILLAGDAAHAISAFGGPALNVGLQDAVNLSWKLAAQVGGCAPPGILDTYHAERHPVAARVLMHTQAQSALMAPGPEISALRELFGDLLGTDGVLRGIAELLHGSDVRYDMDGARPHPLTGGLAPDLPLVTDGGTTRVARLLHAARPVVLDLAGRSCVREAALPWTDRVDIVSAHPGEGRPADSLLIRPDAYVAWAAPPGEADDQVRDGLRRALTRWFGAGR